MGLWATLIRKIELFIKHVLTLTPLSMECGLPDSSKANFWCDSWQPPWPCVPCKRLRQFLRRGKLPGMMFLQTAKHLQPRCWFWSTGNFEMTQEAKRNIGRHFHATFFTKQWKLFRQQFEKMFFGREA